MRLDSIHPAIAQVIAQVRRLPERLGYDDLEVVVWDGASPINGASPLQVRASWSDPDGRPCDDAKAVLLRERASGIVFCVQYQHPNTLAPLRSEADIEASKVIVLDYARSGLATFDAGPAVMACLRNAAAAAGLSPQQMAAMLGRLDG